jgi:hypothetical protein
LQFFVLLSLWLLVFLVVCRLVFQVFLQSLFSFKAMIHFYLLELFSMELLSAQLSTNAD